TEDLEYAEDSGLGGLIMENISSQIYLPNDDADDLYTNTFGLSDEEAAYVEIMNQTYRHFMLKRQSETIVAELNLGGMDKVLSILSGTDYDDDDGDSLSREEQMMSDALAMEYD
ncbi:MAG: hypothetical protein MRY32_05225, partial [Rickettsiales bacterium]|nr:hypothetical protein [Rickettsiales bacterium]